MLLDDAFEDYDVTSTPFRVTVSESEPYQFGQYVTQDVNASVRLTHLVYTPPTTCKAWDEYYAQHRVPAASRTAHSDAPELGKGVVSVVAKLRTLLLDGSIASFVVACFPLDSSRVVALDKDRQLLETAALSTGAASPAVETPQTLQRFNDLFDVVVPLPSDIAANLDIRFDVDGSVALEVEGPGQVTFTGEQFSALIPEWRNHKIFRVGAGDEELPEDEEDDFSDGEMAEMYRLAR